METDENLLDEKHEENTVNKKIPLIYSWGRNEDG